MSQTNQTQIKNITSYHKNEGQEEIIKQHQELVDKSMLISEFKQKFIELTKDTDFDYDEVKKQASQVYCQTHAYIIKIISTKSQSVKNVFCLTQDLEVIELLVVDNDFVDIGGFPKESQLIFLDNLTYSHSITVNK